MHKLVSYLKQNKLVVVLVLALIYLISKNYFPNTVNYSTRFYAPTNTMDLSYSTTKVGVGEGGIMPPVQNPTPTDSSERLTVQDTSLSVLVNSVENTITQIEKVAVDYDGYLVNSNLDKPEGAATGSITIRVDSKNRGTALTAIRALGKKIVSENVSGYDVTDQYSDLEARLITLYATQTKFQSILNSATSVQDILEVTRELTNLQTQIDSIKGQQKYLEATARLTRITVSLSTDELALPYTPDTTWRPAVIFKTAVRSLIGSLRSVGSAAIWVAVYSPFWFAALLGYYLYRRSHKTR
jgi:hypothetical protein